MPDTRLERFATGEIVAPPVGATLDNRFQYMVSVDNYGYWGELVGEEWYWYDSAGTIGRALTELWHASLPDNTVE